MNKMLRITHTFLLLLCLAPMLVSCGGSNDGGGGSDGGVNSDSSGGSGDPPPPSTPPPANSISYSFTLTGMTLTRSDDGASVPVDGLPLSSNITVTVGD